MPVEGFTYRLHVRGRPAGHLQLRTGERGRIALVEARMELRGVLGSTSWTQTSRCHALRHHSLRWREGTDDRPESRAFEVHFDTDEGLVTATRGRHDIASAPYLLPYRDPLSLLRELRAVTAADAAGRGLPRPPCWRIPLLGKHVTVARIADVEVESDGSRRAARAYTLHPGGSTVVVDLSPPHTILRLVQRLDDSVLEGTLLEVTSETTMAGWEEPSESAAQRSGRRRGRRRRRGRGRG